MLSMIRFIIILLTVFSCSILNAEVRIHMENEGGVYKVPCTINGLKLKFIFDTGASNVFISQTYAEMMLENGYLDESDIKGLSQSTIADGSIVDNVVINLRTVEVGGLVLENVSAMVVPSQNAPLLLGQSVIQRLGKVTFEGEYLVIHSLNNYTEEELDAVYEKAEKCFENDQNLQALESYKIIYDSYGDNTSPWVLYNMGICYSRLDDDNSAAKCHMKAIELADGEDDEEDIKFEAYYKLGLIYSSYSLGEYDKAIKYYLHASEYTGKDLLLKAKCYSGIAYNYSFILNDNQDIVKAIEYYKKVETIYNSISSIDSLTMAELYYKIADCYYSNDFSIHNKRYYKAIEYLDKAITAYNYEIKKNRKFEEIDIRRYIDSYFHKAFAQERLSKFEEAIDTNNIVKDKLKKYDSQITDRQWYDLTVKVVNDALSRCYKKLNE